MDNNHAIALKWLQSTIRSQQKQVVKTADTKETAALAENKPRWLCSEGSCEGEDADGKRHRQMRPTGWGSAQDHCCWHGSPVLDARAHTGLAPQKRGAAAVWSSGLQRHPKLGLGAAAASASPRGRWKRPSVGGLVSWRTRAGRLKSHWLHKVVMGLTAQQPQDESTLKSIWSCMKKAVLFTANCCN